MYTRVLIRYDVDSFLENIASKSGTFYNRMTFQDGTVSPVWIGNAYSVSGFQHMSVARHFLNEYKNHPNEPLVDSEQFFGQKPEIPVHYFKGKEKSGSTNFKKDCRSGMIVHHPYKAWSGFVRAGEIWTSFNTTSTSIRPFTENTYQHYTYYTLYQGAIYRDSNGYSRRCFNVPGSRDAVWYIEGENDSLVRTRTEQIISVPPRNVELQRRFEEYCVSSLEGLDDTLVVETLSKANDKEIDLLTTLAELPKTLQSVVDGFRLIAKITKDAKRREFELTESYTKLLENNAKLAASRASNAKRNKRSRKQQDKTAHFKRWSDQNEQKFASQQATEILDAITGVWMNYRYNIRPIVYTIQDTVSAVQKWSNQYLTVRTVKTIDLDPVEIPGYTFTGTSKVTHRCWIKRRYDTSDDWNKFTKVVMGDIFVTAYELIPVWSIVADWFFNIGPVLRAASYNPVYLQQAATYSVKVEVKGSYFLNTDPTVFYDVEFRGYKRKSITPSQHVTLTYVNTFDDLKGYDSLSFLWASLRKPVKKIPSPYRRG